jgi:hypothetical protein
MKVIWIKPLNFAPGYVCAMCGKVGPKEQLCLPMRTNR